MNEEHYDESCALAAGAISAAFRDALSSEALAALVESVLGACASLDPEALSRRCRRSRRTLARDLRKAGLPTPAAVVAWGRIFAASEMLADESRSVESVSLALGLSDSAALVHLYRHHAGPTPGEVRERGGIAYAIGIFKARVARSRLG